MYPPTQMNVIVKLETNKKCTILEVIPRTAYKFSQAFESSHQTINDKKIIEVRVDNLIPEISFYRQASIN